MSKKAVRRWRQNTYSHYYVISIFIVFVLYKFKVIKNQYMKKGVKVLKCLKCNCNIFIQYYSLFGVCPQVQRRTSLEELWGAFLKEISACLNLRNPSQFSIKRPNRSNEWPNGCKATLCLNQVTLPVWTFSLSTLFQPYSSFQNIFSNTEKWFSPTQMRNVIRWNVI